MSTERRIHPLARELNDALKAAAPEVLAMLSAYGRRLYFPKGIISQSAEADRKASRYNATIGIATEGAEPMHLASIQRHLAGMEPGEVYPYAPPAGRPSLRELWWKKLVEENPALRDKRCGGPIVTSAITHGLSLAGDLFVDPDDCVLLPDMLWGNYRLLYEVRFGAAVQTYPFYAGSGLDTRGFAESLRAAARDRDKLVVLLNFPNNPTGYPPTPDEGEAITRALGEQAERGTRLVAIVDDAYFGLFYHLGGESMTESLFGILANRHPNLLAIKLDGATKELFGWGLRCGFISFGPGRKEGADRVAEVLVAKTCGAIRGGISNVSQLSQALVEKALSSSSLVEERRQKRELLRARAEQVYEVVNAPRFRESWTPYRFNSGYFMCVRVEGVKAEKVRQHLLDHFAIGVVATSATDLRIAFSCLEIEQIEPLFEALHKAIQELR